MISFPSAYDLVEDPKSLVYKNKSSLLYLRSLFKYLISYEFSPFLKEIVKSGFAKITDPSSLNPKASSEPTA